MEMGHSGKYLKAERENRHLSLAEVAKSLRIQTKILHAIEEGKDDLLPSLFYQRAFLSAYAKYLGLDPHVVMAGSPTQWSSPPPIPPPIQPKYRIGPLRKGRTRVFIPLVVAGAATLLFFSAAYHISDDPVQRISQLFVQETPDTTQPSPIIAARGTRAKSEDRLPIQTTLKNVLESASALEPSTSFEIAEAAIGKELESESGFLKLRGVSAEFACNNQKIYFLTRTEGKKEGKLTHVWSWEGREFYRIEIDIKPPTRSVYSYLILRPQHSGRWTVEVKDGDSILNKLTFKATPPENYS